MLNPLLGPLLRRKDKLLADELMIRKANRISAYYLNLNKKYDLDNYLHSKPITPLDFLRALWHLLSIWTGYADTYRNEQFVPKFDFAYEHEVKLHIINFKNPCPAALSTNLLIALSCEMDKILSWWFGDGEDEEE